MSKQNYTLNTMGITEIITTMFTWTIMEIGIFWDVMYNWLPKWPRITNPLQASITSIACANVPQITRSVPARAVLYILSWSGFLVSFMLRSDINIAIIAMVKETKIINFNKTKLRESYCDDGEELIEELKVDYGGSLEWSSQEQSYILASFYSTYMLSQFVGGWAAHKYGAKYVFGYSQLAAGICSLSIPWISEVHYLLVMLVKLIQGFVSGLTWPAMYSLIGRWIPMLERSRFISSFTGASIGVALTYPLCGVLIANLGWRSVFYTTGTITLLWCIFWYLLAFDSPEIHPRISLSEKQYIKANTEGSSFGASRQKIIPWSKILTSKTAWAISIGSFGRSWMTFTFLVSGPKYMRTILGFSIEKNGLLNGAPWICTFLAAVLACYLADKILTKNCMTLTNVRKLFSAIAQVIPGLLMLLLGYLGCNIELILVVWFFSVALLGATLAGTMANIVDIAPNFSGPVMAFSQTILMLASFISPLVTGYLTKDGYALSGWRNMFYLSSFIGISAYVVYHIFGTAEIQSWNNSEEDNINTREQEPFQVNGSNADNNKT